MLWEQSIHHFDLMRYCYQAEVRSVQATTWNPPWSLYRDELSKLDRISLALFSAAALPLLVAITQIGLDTHTMRPEVAVSLVGAGMLSVLVYPLLGLARHRQAERERPLSS